MRGDVEIKSSAGALHTGRLEFRNNLALNKATKGMPEKSFSIEFWARGRALDKSGGAQDVYSQLFSYAAQRLDDPARGPDFADDAIRIERYLEDFKGDAASDQKTTGAISVHINSNGAAHRGALHRRRRRRLALAPPSRRNPLFLPTPRNARTSCLKQTLTQTHKHANTPTPTHTKQHKQTTKQRTPTARRRRTGSTTTCSGPTTRGTTSRSRGATTTARRASTSTAPRARPSGSPTPAPSQ